MPKSWKRLQGYGDAFTGDVTGKINNVAVSAITNTVDLFTNANSVTAASLASSLQVGSTLTVDGTLYVSENIKHSGNTTNYINFTTDTQKFYTDNALTLTLDAHQGATFAGTVTWSGGNSTDANTAYGWGDHGLSSQDKTDIGNLSGTNTGDVCTTNHASAGYVTTSGWTSSNDGAGSGLDADLLDGLDLHTGRNDNANKVVRTQGSGYCDFGWINTTSGVASGTPTRIYCSQDAYIRYYTPASLAPYILNQGSTKNSHTHSYDNYSSWNLKTGGTQRTTVSSGSDLDIIGGTNVAVSYASGGRVTITSTDTNTNTTYSAGTGMSLSGTTFNCTVTDTNTWRGLGITPSTACAGNDSRLSDARTPTSHTHSYLPLVGGDLTGGIKQTSDTYLKLYSSTNGAQIGLEFSDSTSQSQKGYLRYAHSDSQSYGCGNSFLMESTEATLCLMVDGQIMYNTGIYKKPASGTGAGTRKDDEWDTAYGWGDHANAGYLTSQTDSQTLSVNGKEVSISGGNTITTQDTIYTHPTSAGNKHVPTGGASGKFLKYSSSGTAVWEYDNNTTYAVGDGGLTQKNFTTTLKNKLDGIAAGATATSAPYYTSAISVGDGGLTQKNFTTTLKSKLDGIAAGATNVTNNNQLTNGAGYVTSDTNTQLSNEQVQDIVGAMFSGNSESNITVTYQDSDGTIDLAATNTTYSVGDGGLTQANFTDALRTKLNGIDTSADVNRSISSSISSTSTTTSASSAAAKSAYDIGNHSHPYAASSHTHSYLPLSGGTLTGSVSMQTGTATFGNDAYNTTPNPTKLAVFGRFYCDIGAGYPFTVYDSSAGENLFEVDGGDCVKIDPEGALGATEFGGGITIDGNMSGATNMATITSDIDSSPTIYVDDDAPSGGSSGDIWLEY